MSNSVGTGQSSYLAGTGESGFLDDHDAKTRRRSSPEPSSSRNGSFADHWQSDPIEEREEQVKKGRKTSAGTASNLTSE
jgi:hypothetical protein